MSPINRELNRDEIYEGRINRFHLGHFTNILFRKLLAHNCQENNAKNSINKSQLITISELGTSSGSFYSYVFEN